MDFDRTRADSQEELFYVDEDGIDYDNFLTENNGYEGLDLSNFPDNPMDDKFKIEDYKKIYEDEIAIAERNRAHEANDLLEEGVRIAGRQFANLVSLTTSESQPLDDYLTHKICGQIPIGEHVQPIRATIIRTVTDQQPQEPTSDKNRLCKQTLDYDLENKSFRLINEVLSLVQTPVFCAKMIEQLSLFHNIKRDVNTEIRLYLKDNEEPVVQTVFRFGDSLKDVFQGYDIETVCRVVLVCLMFKVGALRFEFSQKEARLLITANVTVSELERQLLYIIEGEFGYNFGKMLQGLIGKTELSVLNNLFSSHTMTKDITVTKEAVRKLFDLELTEALKTGILTNAIAFEFEPETVFFWLLNNLAHDEYLPYLYAVHNFRLSFLNIYGAVLNMRSVRISLEDSRADPFSEKFLESKQGDPTAPEPLIFLHRKLTNLKNSKEILFDFCFLAFKSSIHKDWKSGFHVSDLAQKISKIITNSQPSINKTPFNFKSFMESDKSFFTVSKQLISQYISGQLSLVEFDVVNKFLHSRSQIQLLKLCDQSYLTTEFIRLNNQFLSLISAYPAYGSLVNNMQNFEKNNELPDLITKFLGPDSKNGDIQLPKISALKTSLLTSEEVSKSLKTKIEEEKKTLQNVVCFANIHEYAKSLPALLNEKISTADPKFNEKPSSDYRFAFDSKSRRIMLPETLKRDVHNRKLKPEQVFSFDEFSQLWDEIEGMHWKVQNGLITWFCMFANPFPYKRRILKLLKDWGLSRVCSRAVAIQFFGVISKLYKLLEDAQHLEGYHEEFSNHPYVSEIPIEIMSDIDTAFGFCETTRTENSKWDREFLEHLIEWMNRKTAEKLFGIDTSYDFRLFFAHLTSDMRSTLSTGNFEQKKVIIMIERAYYDEKDSMLTAMAGKPSPVHSYKYFDKSEECGNQIQYPSYDRYCGNFYNLSATGSAKKWVVGVRESEEMTSLQYENVDQYNKVRNKLKRAPTSNQNQEPKKTLSKTIGFAVSGKELPLYFIDVYGDAYVPELNCFIKHESKKLRHVINADLVSFAKQSYVHDWVKDALSPNVANKINSFMNERTRLLALSKMKSTLNFEKWCVPIDLKDFHHHFGPSHYETFANVLHWRATHTVKSEEVQKSLLKILKHLGNDLSKGVLTFELKSKEDNLFDLNTGANKGKFHMEKFVKRDERDNPVEFRYSLSLPVHNGLMSGWKMTSMLGSLFNLTLNKLSQFYTLIESSDLAFDLNVLGDDTHLKRRHLASSANHIAFVNMLGKIAHPDKQTISTVSSEFLKKKINTVTHRVNFPNNRTWSSMLFTKDTTKDVLKDRGFVKDMIDLFNLFLSRITSKEIVKSILERRVFERFLRDLANIRNEGATHAEKEADLKRISTDIQALLDTPTYYSGSMGGMLRKLVHNFASDKEKMMAVESHFRRPRVRVYLKVMELNLKPGQCRGIESNINGILRRFKNEDENWKIKFRREVLMVEANELFEGKSEYHVDEEVQLEINKDVFRNQKDRVAILSLDHPKAELTGGDPRELFPLGHETFNIERFLATFEELVREHVIKNYKYSGVIGQLIYHNEKVSSKIKNLLIDLARFKVNLWPLFLELKSLSPFSEMNHQITKQTFEKLSGTIMLDMATSSDFGISISRNFGSDEVIGYMNYMLKKHLVFYLIQNPINHLDIEQRGKLIKEAAMTIDIYTHQHAKVILERIEAIFAEKISTFVN